MGAAAGYRVVAPKGVSAKAGRDFGQDPLGNQLGAVCTSKIKQQDTDVIDFDTFIVRPILVALATRGTAIRMVAAKNQENDFFTNEVQGDIITGGGAIAGLDLESFLYSTDTTGTSPALDACAQAMADIRTGSAALAALPPTQTFGAVRVRTDETVVIDATGGAVIQMDSLTMDDATSRYYGYEKNCNAIYAAGHEPARLEIHAGDGDDVVINVNRLSIGGCTRLLDDRGAGLPNVLFNLPGRGARISFGPEAGTEGAAGVLAPDRTLTLTGSPDLDTLTQVGRAWVRNLRLVGGTGIPGCCVDGLSCPIP
jgi:hypothetical protein